MYWVGLGVIGSKYEPLPAPLPRRGSSMLEMGWSWQMTWSSSKLTCKVNVKAPRVPQDPPVLPCHAHKYCNRPFWVICECPGMVIFTRLLQCVSRQLVNMRPNVLQYNLYELLPWVFYRHTVYGHALVLFKEITFTLREVIRVWTFIEAGRNWNNVGSLRIILYHY